MSVQWLVAKYIPDLRRREPVNIGVVLITPSGVYSRFLGDRGDGEIDGRKVRLAGSVVNYKAWVGYWRTQFEQVSFRPDAFVGTHADENYFLEFGGERLLGASEISDTGGLMDFLYSMLVEEVPEPSTLNVTELSESVLHSLEIESKVEKNVHLDVALDKGVRDTACFDYRYENGAVSLMHRVNLIWDDERSWDQTHAAAWNFDLVSLPNGGSPRLIALVKADVNNEHADRQLAVLRNRANVIDVVDQARAVDKLGDLLGVR